MDFVSTLTFPPPPPSVRLRSQFHPNTSFAAMMFDMFIDMVASDDESEFAGECIVSLDGEPWDAHTYIEWLNKHILSRGWNFALTVHSSGTRVILSVYLTSCKTVDNIRRYMGFDERVIYVSLPPSACRPKIYEHGECSVCHDAQKPVRVIYRQCRHLCLCIECALAYASKRCPVCAIESSMTTIDSLQLPSDDPDKKTWYLSDGQVFFQQ